MSNYLNTVKELISDKTGLEASEIDKESYFQDDLNMGEMELLEILEELEEIYQIDLVDEKDTVESVQDLVDVLTEKLD